MSNLLSPNSNPAIRQSGNPAIRQSGNPAIRQSGNPAIRQSGKLSSRLIPCQAPSGVFLSFNYLLSHPFGIMPLSALKTQAAAFSYHIGATPRATNVACD
jgi:hypothetical protein